MVTPKKWSQLASQNLTFFSHVALHFSGSVSFLKKFLFLASLLKLNAFHWHFADDQAVQVLLHTKARLHH